MNEFLDHLRGHKQKGDEHRTAFLSDKANLVANSYLFPHQEFMKLQFLFSPVSVDWSLVGLHKHQVEMDQERTYQIEEF